MHAKSLQSCLTLCDPMDSIAHQAPLFMGFCRQEYWAVLPYTPPGNFPTQGSNPRLLCLLLWQVVFLPPVLPRKPRFIVVTAINFSHLILCYFPIPFFFLMWTLFFSGGRLLSYKLYLYTHHTCIYDNNINTHSEHTLILFNTLLPTVS